jgi:hypothetical protein
MKNIHLIPTDKPSRLAKHSSGSFHIVSYIAHKKGLYKMTNQHIYITSDEEIKEGGYVFWEGKIYAYREFMKMRTPVYTDYFPTILTTDPDLIKDGIQAIDDEFLEWFVKNPSCEEVEVKDNLTQVYPRSGRDAGGNERYEYNYKIIIPQEENNAEKINQLLVLALKLPNEDLKILSNSIVGRLPQEEPKQETIEEAAKYYVKMQYPMGVEKEYPIADFKAGAEWQEQMMYSDKEVESLLHKFMQSQHPDWHGYSTTKWFEQNKKK